MSQHRKSGNRERGIGKRESSNCDPGKRERGTGTGPFPLPPSPSLFPFLLLLVSRFPILCPGSRRRRYGLFSTSMVCPMMPPRTAPAAPPITAPFSLSRLVVAPMTAPAAAPIAASRFVLRLTTCGCV